MKPTEEEKQAAIAELETPEEKAERESAGINKPRRGRPPGSSNKPKLSDAALELGCKQLVSFLWMLARPFCAITNRSLSPLSESERIEGAEQAKALVLRFNWLAILLMFIGFPFWFATKVYEHAERIMPRKHDASVIALHPQQQPTPQDAEKPPA